MVTGDAPATAAIVAHAVALTVDLPARPASDKFKPEQFAVFAGIFPRKIRPGKGFPENRHTSDVRDGANDAPRYASQMGVAVSTATDVAKSAPELF